MALHLKSTGIDFTDFGDATETAELLNDYEEGTFVPTATNDHNGCVGLYTKIGSAVFCQMWIAGDNNAATGNNWSGLPFESDQGSNAVGGGTCQYQNETGAATFTTFNGGNSSGFALYHGPTQQAFTGTNQSHCNVQYMTEGF